MSRILLASHPFDGHFNPFTQLAVHLKERGHDVRWYTGPSYRERVERLGITHHPFRRAREINASNLTEHIPGYDEGAMSPRVLELGVREMFFAPIEPQYQDVAEIHRSFPFDAFICDAAMYLSRFVAEQLEPRVYVVSCAPTPAPTSNSAPAPFFGFMPAKSFVGRARDAIANRMIARTMRSGLELLADFRRREGLPPYTGSAFDLHVEKSRAIFQCGVPGLDFPRTDWPRNFQFIGALLPKPRGGALPDGLLEKLDRHATVVAVSQGTTDNRDPGKLFIPTLEALAGGPSLVVVTTGGLHTAELRRRFPEDNVVVEDWIDFQKLLPRCNAFVCNGGFGSVLLSLTNGVPVLAAGKLEGKADINARLAYRGLGVDLRTERPTARQIRSGLSHLLRDVDLRARVADVQSELARHQPLDIVDRVLQADGIHEGCLVTQSPRSQPLNTVVGSGLAESTQPFQPLGLGVAERRVLG